MNQTNQQDLHEVFDKSVNHIKYYLMQESPYTMVKGNLEKNLIRISQEYENVQTMLSLQNYHFDLIMQEIERYASRSRAFYSLYNVLMDYFQKNNQVDSLMAFVDNEFNKTKQYIMSLMQSIDKNAEIQINYQNALTDEKSPSITFRMAFENYFTYLSYCDTATTNFLKYCSTVNSAFEKNLMFLMVQMKKHNDTYREQNFNYFYHQSIQKLKNMLKTCVIKKKDLKSKTDNCEPYESMYKYGSPKQLKKIFKRAKKYFTRSLENVAIHHASLAQQMKKYLDPNHTIFEDVKLFLKDCDGLNGEIETYSKKASQHCSRLERLFKKIKSTHKPTLKTQFDMHSISPQCTDFKKDHFENIFLYIHESFDEINDTYMKLKYLVETHDFTKRKFERYIQTKNQTGTNNSINRSSSRQSLNPNATKIDNPINPNKPKNRTSANNNSIRSSSRQSFNPNAIMTNDRISMIESDDPIRIIPNQRNSMNRTNVNVDSFSIMPAENTLNNNRTSLSTQNRKSFIQPIVEKTQNSLTPTRKQPKSVRFNENNGDLILYDYED